MWRKKLNQEKAERFFTFLMESAKKWESMDEKDKEHRLGWIINYFKNLYD